MFTFIHAADVHLDSPLRGLERYDGAPVEQIRGASRRALQNLVGLAIDRKVAFVLIAGDLYDGDWHDHGTGLFLNSQMARLRDAGVRVYLIRGNHDAASQITKHLRLPDNVRLLGDDRPESVADDDLGCVVHGQGFASRSVRDNLAASYPTRWAGYVNIGLLHTCATGRDGHESYAPCSVEELRSKGYDYWALGHIHKRELLHDDPPILFCGNVQGRHVRETGPKGCTLVKVKSGRVVDHEPHALDVLRWDHVRVDSSSARDDDEALALVGDRLRASREEAEGRLVAARLELFGVSPAHERIVGRPEEFEARVRDLARDIGSGSIWVERVRLRTSPPRLLDPDDGPLGVLLSLIEELRADDDRLRALARSELEDLRKKLPAELNDPDGSLNLDAPGRLREALDEVWPLIAHGLAAPGGSA